MKIHHPTPDESTWAWWNLLWAVGEAKFNRKMVGATPSSLPEEDVDTYLTGIKGNKFKGQVMHQNSCGHGYVPKGDFLLLDYTNHSRIKSPSEHEYGGMDNYGLYKGTLLGASPAEVQFVGHEDHQKRWSNN